MSALGLRRFTHEHCPADGIYAASCPLHGGERILFAKDSPMPPCGRVGCEEAVVWTGVVEHRTAPIPAGAGRDAAIAEALGWGRAGDPLGCSSWNVRAGLFFTNWAPSADLAACDRLVQELANRGWFVRDVPGPVTAVECIRATTEGPQPIACQGTTRLDAVTAAALLALTAMS